MAQSQPDEIPKTDGKAGSERDDNGAKIKLVWCPRGTFTMGRAMKGYESYFCEFQAEVTLTKGFWIGKHEVTQAEWEKIMGTKPWSGKTLSGEIGKAKEGSDFAAAWLTWEDAVAFCNKLTESERLAGRLGQSERYTLPTEAQWEYACRAGTATRFCFGNEVLQIGEYAWWGALYHGNAEGEPYPHQVGLKKPNPWGIHDMHGNVHEWCHDYYEDKIIGGKDPAGPVSGSMHVVRGGSWYSEADYCRSTMRFGVPPDLATLHEVGFRVALVSD